MKSTILKLATFALCCLMPITYSFAGGLVGWSTIASMEQRGCVPSKGLEITFTTDHANPDVCFDSMTVELSCDRPNYNQILAMALMAMSAGLEVNGYVDKCDAQGHAIILSFEIR